MAVITTGNVPKGLWPGLGGVVPKAEKKRKGAKRKPKPVRKPKAA